MSTCVFILEILKNFKALAGVTLLRIHFVGSTCSKNRLAGWSFFQNLGSQGPGCTCVSPGGSSRAAPSTFFAACSEASEGFNWGSKVLLKSQCKKYGIWKGKIKPHLGKVCIFLPTLFYKNHRNIML